MSLKRFIPCPWRAWYRHARTESIHIWYSFSDLLHKNRADQLYYCPCCKTRTSFRRGVFAEHPELYNPERYQNIPQEVICPVCHSLPRHRILAMWCEENIKQLRESNILYFAMEQSMDHWFWKNGISCITADLLRPADLQMDIQQTGLPDACFDMVFCNHVLEHVDDYNAALKEMFRILRPGGILMCSFPIDPGIDKVEQASPSLSRDEHIQRFGQYDHNRVFGPNADELLSTVGFSVEIISGDRCPAVILPVIGPADYDANILFCCTRLDSE